MPCLRISAGPSMSNLRPIHANSGEGVDVSSDVFEGRVAIFIKNLAGPNVKVQESAYFEHEERKDVTWSIQVQGRFLREYNANDVLFGNVFDRPLPIPWGFSTILGFMQYIDPTLEQDLTSKTKPWALSPLISTMPHFAHRGTLSGRDVPHFPPMPPLRETTSQLKLKDGRTPPELKVNKAAKRRAYFQKAETRENFILGPEDIFTADFCYGYLLFSPQGVALQLPAGFSLDMLKYWDGQPIYFVCCERSDAQKTDTGRPLGRVFWCIAIEILEGEAEGSDGEQDAQASEDNSAANVAADDVD